MNIVRLTTRIYPDKAGPAVYTYLLSEHISNKNFKMFNISGRPKTISDSFKLVNSNFRIDYLPITAPRWDVKIHKHLLFLIKYGIYSFRKILKLHRHHRIDLIHCDNPAITGVIAVLFNRLLKIPFIYTHHGLDSHFKLNFLLELRLIYRYSTNNLIVSRKMEKFFKKNKIDTSKLIWVPVGIDLKNFFHVETKSEKEKIIKELDLSSLLTPDDHIIIYVGYMDLKQKVLGMIDFLYGFNDFIKNLDENKRKNVKLLYLGDGKYKNLLSNEVDTLNLNNEVFLLGVRLDIEKFYAISDFGALTSYMEGFPIVLLEAVASKIPCICTDVGEVKEIVDEKSIVSCGKRVDITAKLKQFYEDKDLCREISEESYAKIKKFEWDNIANQIRTIYKNAVRKKN